MTIADSIWKENAKTGKTQLFSKDRRLQDLRGITCANGVSYVADSHTIFGTPVNDVATATSDGPSSIWKVTP